MIFVNSMSDLFHELVPFEFVDRVFAVMGQAPHHTFQVPTKRPERMRDHMIEPRRTVPSNVWLGTSIENSRFTWRATPVERLSQRPGLTSS
jgi:protein gp37